MDSRKNRRDLAVIGAGPIGLEAALYARKLGHRVRIYERGAVAGNVLRWDFVELFSPWELNTSPLGLEVLRRAGVEPLPRGASHTGAVLRDRYLLPIARSFGDTLLEQTGITAVARDGFLKTEAIGSDERARRPFRLLVRRADGTEEDARADCVIDATGVYQNPCRLGNGGAPAVGELSAADRIDYHLPDIPGRDREAFEGRRTLVVGGGYSAATALLALAGLGRGTGGSAASTEVVWAWKTAADEPVPVVDDDPLPARDRLARAANALAVSPPPGCSVRRGRTVESIARAGGGLDVTLRDVSTGATDEIRVDRLLALVGYRPDPELSRELHVHACYATEGPMKLAAALLASGSGLDCLAQRNLGTDVLVNPEPGFFVIGHKSYGRRTDFLLRNGREQIREVFRLIEDDPGLDLYHG